MSRQGSRLDAFVHKIPGSTAFKAFSVSLALCAVAAYPIFSKPPEQTRQGHDYMSSDKPEIIRSSQEKIRKDYRDNRNAETAEKKEQEQKKE